MSCKSENGRSNRDVKIFYPVSGEPGSWDVKLRTNMKVRWSNMMKIIHFVPFQKFVFSFTLSEFAKTLSLTSKLKQVFTTHNLRFPSDQDFRLHFAVQSAHNFRKIWSFIKNLDVEFRTLSGFRCLCSLWPPPRLFPQLSDVAGTLPGSTTKLEFEIPGLNYSHFVSQNTVLVESTGWRYSKKQQSSDSASQFQSKIQEFAWHSPTWRQRELHAVRGPPSIGI